MKSWYHLSEEEVLNELQTNQKNGLTEEESAARLEKYGPNELEGHKRESMLKRILGQLKDPMIIVLLAAAVVSYVSSGFTDWVEPLIILLIVDVNTVISTTQEDNANKALEALQKMSAPLAKVIRGGQMTRVETGKLVPVTSSCWRRATWYPPTPASWIAPT